MAWSECSISNPDNVGLAFHASCLVIHPKSKGVQLYKMESNPNDDLPKIKEEGLYVFGGRNEFGEINNTLRILKTGSSGSVNMPIIRNS